MTDSDPAGGYRNDDGRGGRDGTPPIPPGPFTTQQPDRSVPTDRRGPVPVFGAPENPEASGYRQAQHAFAAPGSSPGQPTGPGGYQGQPPQGAAPWGNTGFAPNPYSQQGPGGPYPMGPPPRKGGMPVWGWILIGVGVLVLGFIGLILTLFFIGLSAGVSGSTSSEPLPLPSEISIPESTFDTDFEDLGGGTEIDAPELQPLEVSASFITPPSWGLPTEPWVLDDTPAEGTFFFSNPNSCDMILEQAYMPPELEGEDDFSSDSLATQSYLTYLLEYFAELEGGTTEGTPGTIPLSINFAGGPTMDLATTTLPGLTLDGNPGVRYVATRAMPLSTGVVSTIITCPQAVLDADPAYFETAVAGLYIMPSP